MVFYTINLLSDTSTLFSYANDLPSALDSGMCVDSEYFDFSRAFDKVRHDYLIHKLKKYGLSGCLLKWIIDYLSYRTQVVKIKGYTSSGRRAASGVIHGSVLGPLLFTVFLDDVDNDAENSSILKYADDIRIYRSFKSDSLSQPQNNILFQSDIDALFNWSTKWDLHFNSSKCCVLHFGRSNNQAYYSINVIPLVKKGQEKDLGIIFSTNFKFDQHTCIIYP